MFMVDLLVLQIMEATKPLPKLDKDASLRNAHIIMNEGSKDNAKSVNCSKSTSIKFPQKKDKGYLNAARARIH